MIRAYNEVGLSLRIFRVVHPMFWLYSLLNAASHALTPNACYALHQENWMISFSSPT